MIKERLPEAVQQCIHAAAGEHEPAIQRGLLRVSLDSDRGSPGNRMILMFSCYVLILTATRSQGGGGVVDKLRFLTQ